MVRFGFYKNGKRKCLTFSYDDARVEDRELIRIFNEYGMKGSFHINASFLDKSVNHIASAEVAELYKGHEVSCHGLTHPFLERLPAEEMAYEILEDRRRLEALCKYPVRGMSYPFGTYNQTVVDALPAYGIKYARTIQTTGKFELPDNFLIWNPTCHHNNDIYTKAEIFKKARPLSLFYIWGHSFEFTMNNSWDIIKRFCDKISEDDDIWYATNIELYDYISALRALQFTANRDFVYNPTAIDVWLEVDGIAVKVAAGESVSLI